MNQWPIVPLKYVIQLQRRWINIQPTELYREIGIRSFGNGIFHKTPVEGSTLGDKRVLRIEPGDLVFNNVFAWEGAVAVAGPGEEGTIGSHRFVTYTVSPEYSTAEFLKLFFTTPQGREILLKVSPGSAGRNKTLGLDRFIAQSVPLPPLGDQRRIIERVHAVAAKVKEAKLLRQEADGVMRHLFAAKLKEVMQAQSDWTERPLGQLVTTVRGQVDPRMPPYCDLPHINGESIESGSGRLLSNYRTAGEDGVTSGKYHFKPLSVLYSKIRPYLRKCTEVPFEGVCSADVYAFDAISPAVVPRFLVYTLIGPYFSAYANELSGRTRMPKLNQDQLFAFKMRYPTRVRQQALVEYLDALQSRLPLVQHAQSKASAEISALLPAALDRAFRGEL